MPEADLILRGRNVAVQDHGKTIVRPASIHIRSGSIFEIAGFEEVPDGGSIETVRDESVIMAGLVDSHVHINEPGRTHWEGFVTATRAAAAGGVTTLVDMPLNSIPPTTTPEAFQAKLTAAAGNCFVDVGFWGGVVPGNTAELSALGDMGVVGFKCFLIHSGVDEFPNVTENDLRGAMGELSRLNSVLIVHAELPGPVEAACCAASSHSSVQYQTFLDARPRAAENAAVELMIRLSREFGTRIHIVHHSSADALPMLRAAKDEGVKITAETCPHYLYFAAEQIADGATQFKCCPPIREQENQEQLWRALGEGTIDMVVSDHSPCPPDLKCLDEGDFMKAWGGISSLQFRLPIMWTGASRRGHSLAELTRWLCAAPAELVGFEKRKGKLAVGYDADIVVWNPNQEFRVEPEIIHHRHRVTPYQGEVLKGVVQKTFLRGGKIYDGGEFFGDASGELLRQ